MSNVKWLRTQALSINLSLDSPASTARPIGAPTVVGGRANITRLAPGTSAGRTAVVLQLDFDDGTTVCLETTLALLDGAVRAFKARDEMEGRPQ